MDFDFEYEHGIEYISTRKLIDAEYEYEENRGKDNCSEDKIVGYCDECGAEILESSGDWYYSPKVDYLCCGQCLDDGYCVKPKEVA